jgi:hypothetical protein
MLQRDELGVSFTRSFYMTIAALCFLAPVAALTLRDDNPSVWPILVWLFIATFLTIGGGVLVIALYAPEDKLRIEYALCHGGIVLLPLVLPIHWILKAFQARRNKRSITAKRDLPVIPKQHRR